MFHFFCSTPYIPIFIISIFLSRCSFILTEDSSCCLTPSIKFWGTDNYVSYGKGYGEWDEITAAAISGQNGLVLRPRVNKSKEEQESRLHQTMASMSAVAIMAIADSLKEFFMI